jgi:hypothetical protein
VSDCFLPRVKPKMPDIPDNFFPKAAQYKIRKQLREMNVDLDNM